jgi:hypothetical protein
MHERGTMLLLVSGASVRISNIVILKVGLS